MTGFVRPSVGLSHMNYVEYLSNLTTQLDNASLAQPVTKQCFMLFSVCKKSRKHTSAKHDQLKVVLNIYKFYLYEEFWGMSQFTKCCPHSQ